MDDRVDADHQPVALFCEGSDHPVSRDRPRIGLQHHGAAGIGVHRQNRMCINAAARRDQNLDGVRRMGCRGHWRWYLSRRCSRRRPALATIAGGPATVLLGRRQHDVGMRRSPAPLREQVANLLGIRLIGFGVARRREADRLCLGLCGCCSRRVRPQGCRKGDRDGNWFRRRCGTAGKHRSRPGAVWRCSLLDLGRRRHYRYARSHRRREGYALLERGLGLCIVGFTGECQLLGRAVETPGQRIDMLHAGIMRIGRSVASRRRDHDDQRQHSQRRDRQDHQPPRTGTTGRIEYPPRDESRELRAMKVEKRTGHHDGSLSKADTVRPSTESSTTGVFGTA